jgi:NADPH:quinone reductase-like Zn-dependent oxidoreductase
MRRERGWGVVPRQIATLIDSGAVRPVIAQTVPLAEAREAFQRGGAGHPREKLVLAVDKL